MAPKADPQTSLIIAGEVERGVIAGIDEPLAAKLRAMASAGTLNFDALAKDAAIVDLSEFGVGVPLDKEDLVGLPFVIVDWNELQGTFGPFAFVECITADNIRGYFTDGGVGIRDYLANTLSQTGRRSGLYAPRGLTRSEYDTEVDGKPVHGVTFYIG